MSTLFDFDNTPKPTFERVQHIRHPTRPDAGLGEIVKITNRDDQLAMLADRTRYQDSNGNQDYYRLIGGYSMPKRTIKGLLNNSVGLVVIRETDNDRLLEFNTLDFTEHNGPEDWKGTAQYCIPTERAVREWSL